MEKGFENQKCLIKDSHFDAAHYLNEQFGKCIFLHGHRYFITDLKYRQVEVVDFNDIKKAIDSFDHCVIAPEKDFKFWVELSNSKNLPCKIRFTLIPGKVTTVENIAQELKKRLEAIKGISDVTFILTEGENMGVIQE